VAHAFGLAVVPEVIYDVASSSPARVGESGDRQNTSLRADSSSAAIAAVQHRGARRWAWRSANANGIPCCMAVAIVHGSDKQAPHFSVLASRSGWSPREAKGRGVT